jgi:putative addiction module component (TIGR02574 family)
MARSARELFEEAMGLDPEERATLMRLLIETLDEEGVEDAWRVEIERHMAEIDSGAVETIPWEELRARLLPPLNGPGYGQVPPCRSAGGGIGL